MTARGIQAAPAIINKLHDECKVEVVVHQRPIYERTTLCIISLLRSPSSFEREQGTTTRYPLTNQRLRADHTTSSARTHARTAGVIEGLYLSPDPREMSRATTSTHAHYARS